jgi:hypothetical protein
MVSQKSSFRRGSSVSVESGSCNTRLNLDESNVLKSIVGNSVPLVANQYWLDKSSFEQGVYYLPFSTSDDNSKQLAHSLTACDLLLNTQKVKVYDRLLLNKIQKIIEQSNTNEYLDNPEYLFLINEYQKSFEQAVLYRTTKVCVKDYLNGNLSIPLTVKVDYLRLKFIFDSQQEMHNLLKYCFKDDYSINSEVSVSMGKGIPKLENEIDIHIPGAFGGFDIIEYHDEINGELVPNGQVSYNVVLSFSGDFMEVMKLYEQWRFMRGLRWAYGARCTRIDCTIDDPTYQLIPLKSMIAAYYQGNQWGPRTIKIIDSGKDYNAPHSATIYLGSRESEKYFRIYDHDSQCLRMELECKKHYAKYVFNHFTALPRCKALFKQWDNFLRLLDEMDNIGVDNLTEDDYKLLFDRFDIVNCVFENSWDFHNDMFKNFKPDDLGEDYISNEEWDIDLQKFLATYVINAIDYRDKLNVSESTNASKRDCKRFEWWQDFIDLLGCEFKPTRPPRDRSVMRSVKWLWRQVLPTVLMIKKGLGSFAFYHWLLEQLDKCNDRLTPWHDSQVEFIKVNPGLVKCT